MVPSVQSVSVCRRATRAGRLAVQAIGEATQLRDPAWTKDMIAKFKASDINKCVPSPRHARDPSEVSSVTEYRSVRATERSRPAGVHPAYLPHALVGMSLCSWNTHLHDACSTPMCDMLPQARKREPPARLQTHRRLAERMLEGTCCVERSTAVVQHNKSARASCLKAHKHNQVRMGVVRAATFAAVSARLLESTGNTVSLLTLCVTCACSDGIVDRVEFGRLAESTGNLSEFSVFRWLSEKDVDDLFKRYADAASGGITFKRFLKLVRSSLGSRVCPVSLSTAPRRCLRLCEQDRCEGPLGLLAKPSRAICACMRAGLAASHACSPAAPPASCRRASSERAKLCIPLTRTARPVKRCSRSQVQLAHPPTRCTVCRGQAAAGSTATH